jgi:hypothetical protein
VTWGGDVKKGGGGGGGGRDRERERERERDSPAFDKDYDNLNSSGIAAGGGFGEAEEQQALYGSRSEAARLLDPSAYGQGQGQGQAPHGDVKIDVLRELEDIASMTIGETGFFCK